MTNTFVLQMIYSASMYNTYKQTKKQTADKHILID